MPSPVVWYMSMHLVQGRGMESGDRFGAYSVNRSLYVVFLWIRNTISSVERHFLMDDTFRVHPSVILPEPCHYVHRFALHRSSTEHGLIHKSIAFDPALVRFVYRIGSH